MSHLSTDRIGERRHGDTLPESSVPKKKTRFAIGDKIDGKYEVVHILPSGGMGEVYKVRHVLLGDVRIVKVLRADQLANENGKQRFLREAKLAASIKDPNLAALYDFSALPDGSYYMVGEFVDGFTIGDHLESGGRFEPAQVVRIAQHVLRALSALHGKGIIHRDISPDNLMLTRPGAGHSLVKVIDLGIAKAMDGGEGLTSAGFFVGKQGYASPEQLRGDEIDGRSDLYSLGVVLYQIIAGKLPFTASTPTAAMYKKLSEDAKGINEAGKEPVVDSQLEAFILRFLKKAPLDRFQTAEDALKEVDRISQHFEQQDSTLTSILDLKKGAASPSPEPSATAKSLPDEGPATVMMPLPSKSEILAAKSARDAREKPAPPPESTVAYSKDELKRSTVPATTPVPAPQSSTSAPPEATQMISLPAGKAAIPAKPAETPATVILPLPAKPAPAPASAPVPAQATQERKNSAFTWIAIGIITLLVAAGAFGVLRMFSGRNPKEPVISKPVTAKPAPPKRVAVQTPPPVVVPPPVVISPPVVPTDTAPSSTGTAPPAAAVTAPTTPPVEPPVTATVARVVPKVAPKAPPKKKVEKKKPAAPPPTATAPVEPPKPAVQEGELVSLGDPGVVAPVLRQDSEAKYPVRARMAGTKGTTSLSLLIDENGAVENVRLAKSSGSPLLDNSALLAARKARYSPPMKDGVRVKVWITRDYIFRLK